MKTPEEILSSKGIQFPEKRSPRDYNLTLIAMKEYASQLYSEEQVREAFNKGRLWCETYGGWFSPSDRDNLNRENKCIDELKVKAQPTEH